MLYSIKQFIRKIKHVVKKTSQYFMYVCKHNDYDWDYEFLYGLLQWKIDNMSKTIKKNDLVESTDRIVKQLNYASYLLDQLINSKFEEAIYKPLQDKYGNITIECEIIPNTTYTKNIYGYKKIPKGNEELKKEADLAFKLAFSDSHLKRKELKKRLFRHMDLYINRWWD